MRCLITGATGFVGTNLVLHLLKKGEEVIGVDSLVRKGSEKNLEMIKEQFPNFKFKRLEIEEMPHEIILEKPDLVYHFAAQVAVTTSVISPIRDFKINAEGTFYIANAAKKLNIPIIYTSTNKVYGDNVNKVPIKEFEKRYDFGGEFEKKGLPENFSIDAKHYTPYGCSKLVGDIYVREFGGVVNRCSCMYGTNQYGIVDQGWLSFLAARKILNKPVTIFGDGKQVRDALYAEDVVRLLETQADFLLDPSKPDIRGEAFNVGGGYNNTISLLELCDRWNLEPNFDEWRPSDQKVFYCDISKIKRILNWEPRVNLNEGLKNLFSWAEKNLSE
jgi:CDP-paratose 2-epimerase